MSAAMTKTERNELASLVRKRAKLLKTAASQRSHELEAELERHLTTTRLGRPHIKPPKRRCGRLRKL